MLLSLTEVDGIGVADSVAQVSDSAVSCIDVNELGLTLDLCVDLMTGLEGLCVQYGVRFMTAH